MTCNCCEITDNTFNEKEAEANLKDYRKRGPAKQTKLILEAVRSLGLKNAALLDIGGGIGTIHHELLKDVAREATHVDASSAYLKIATEEAKRQGHSCRFHRCRGRSKGGGYCDIGSSGLLLPRLSKTVEICRGEES